MRQVQYLTVCMKCSFYRVVVVDVIPYIYTDCCKPCRTGRAGHVHNVSKLCMSFSVFNAESHLVSKLGTCIPTLGGKNYSSVPLD